MGAHTTATRRGAAALAAGILGMGALGACTGSTGAGSAGPGGAAGAGAPATAPVMLGSAETGTLVATAGGAASASGGSATTAPAGTTPAATTGAATGAASTACTGEQLRITEQSTGAAAGHEGLLLVFTNTGAAACSVSGYPGATLQLLVGRTLDASRTMTGYIGGAEGYGAPPTVTIGSGAAVSALLEWEDVTTDGNAPAGANCQGMGASALLVTPPDSARSTVLTPPGMDCQGLEIHPVIPDVAVRPPGG